jgi:hypothetical protein
MLVISPDASSPQAYSACNSFQVVLTSPSPAHEESPFKSLYSGLPWILIACLILFTWRRSITRILEGFATRLEDGATITVGPVSVTEKLRIDQPLSSTPAPVLKPIENSKDTP